MRTWLLIAGLSLGALAPVQAQEGRLADRLPAETFLYFEIPDAQALVAGARNSALGRTWNSQEVQDFVGDALLLLHKGWEGVRQQATAMGLPQDLLSWEALGSLEFGLAFKAGKSPEGSPRPALAFGLSVGLRKGLAEQVESFLVGMAEGGQIPCQVREEEDGSRCLILPMGQNEGLEIRREGDHLLAFARTGDFGESSLAASPRFQAARRAHEEAGAVCFGYLDFARSTREGLAMLRMIPEEEGQQVADLVEGMMEELGVLDVGPLTFSSGWRQDGLGFSRAVMSFGEGAPRGLLAANVGLRADASLLDYVPADATSFSVVASAPGAGWDFFESFLDRIAAMPAEGHPGQTVGDLWAASGHPSWDWLMGEKRQLLAKALKGLGAQGFSYSTVSGAGGYFQKLQDPDAVRTVLHELIPMAAEALGGIEELPLKLTVKRARVYETGPDGARISRDGPEYYTLSIVASKLPPQFRPMAMLTAQFSPSIGVTEDGWLVTCMNSANIRGYLRSGVKKPEENVRSNPEVAAFLERVPEGASTFSWSDPRPGLQKGWAMIQGMLPMMTMQAGSDLPVDLAKLPSADALTRHLRPTEAWAVATPAGTESYSTGSFQLADVFTVVGAVATVMPPFLVAQEVRKHPPMEPAPEAPIVADTPAPVEGVTAEQRQEVLAELDRLRTGIVVYQIVTQHLPDSLEVLTVPTDEYPRGYLPAAEDGSYDLKPDPWGHPYVYRVTDDGYQLYSMGPDGEDDGGADDDIRLED